MLHTIKNNYLQVTVSELGAELQSIQDRNGAEYLWQGDPKYWKSRATNIFPYVGRMVNSEYFLDGNRYQLDIHGFARFCRFCPVDADDLHLTLELTDSEELARAVDEEIIRQTNYLDRSEIMEASLRDFGCAIVCKDLYACVELANEIAPEHLEIVTRNPRALLDNIENAGAVFLGAWSPEPLGDYLAGPDHVLPTSGTARFFSPLSVDSFLKTMSIIDFDRDSLASIQGKIVTLAETEHLTAHANSIRVRFESM